MGLVPAGVAERVAAYHHDGVAWLEELPALVDRCAVRWGLTVLDAYEPGGDASWVAPVRLPSGAPAVLQLTVPSAAQPEKAVALRAWGSHGAVELYAYDEGLRASLMERCDPGDDASALSRAAADDVAASVLPDLWSAALPATVPALADLCQQRSEVLVGRAAEFSEGAALFLEAAQLYVELPASAGRTVLLHGDFHQRNVLRSARGWLAIDPAPRWGDPAFDVACFLQHDMDDVATIARADALSRRVGLDPSRTRLWLFSVAVQAASWFLSVGDTVRYRAIVDAVAGLR